MLSKRVDKIIKHLTYNFDKEIGAVGIGGFVKDDDGGFIYIKDLLFPKQTVSSATVEFEGDMWADLVKKASLEDLGNICFYWHKHPGSSQHSHTDEKDTFGSFMSKESGRKFFAFLQTAVSGGTMNHEARIELREPLLTTIENEKIDLLVETDKEDDEIKNYCDEIIKTCIVEKKYTQYPQNFKGSEAWTKDWPNYSGYGSTPRTEVKPWGFSQLWSDVAYFFNYEVNGNKTYFDNDLVVGEDDKVSVTLENGCCVIKTKEKFAQNIIEALNSDRLKELVRQSTQSEKDKDGFMTFNIQPAKDSYLDMKDEVAKLFLDFHTDIIKDLKKEADAKDEEAGFLSEDKLVVDNYDLFNYMTALLSEEYVITWDDKQKKADVYDFETKFLIGRIEEQADGSMVFKGKELVELLASDEIKAF